VRLTARASLADVAVVVGDALPRAGIRAAVLTGGACAHLYSGGSYVSPDAHFVLGAPCSRKDLDRAMATVGFVRDRDRYVHAVVPFFVEFPRGPLGIGEDVRIHPVWRKHRTAKTLALSATDACRDRLAAFYHWNDRQSLAVAVAVAIAVRHRIAFAKVRGWSRREGHLDEYAVFIAALRRAGAARRSRGRGARATSRS
jgi:hypothetical protein